jgi:hypothetical protein
MRYTANYTKLATKLYNNDVDNDDIVEQLLAKFELEFTVQLAGLVREDVGAVVLYNDAEGEEQAFFDYELYVGSVYALGGKRSDELG